MMKPEKPRTYLRGDTIRFDVVPGQGFDEGVDFTLVVCLAVGGDKFVFRRDQLERLPSGAWRGGIPSASTASMGTGLYHVELLVRQQGGVNCIAQAPAFELGDSTSKSEI